MARKINKQKKLHVRKGDMVRVIAGNDRGKEGKVLRVFAENERVIVEGVNMRIRHTRPSQTYPQGGRIQQEAAIHISNVMPLDGNGDPTRVGRKRIEDVDSGKGRWVRYAANTGEELDN
ncbi:MAG: 50S ribosomal protein L24 [Rhodothermales bacterium]|nr:50S ribosomal protein L24 [Rhodothermales bacterium]MBO6781412.1 50S ribosomal protein L24 [Rhodothermales bacterium]